MLIFEDQKICLLVKKGIYSARIIKTQAAENSRYLTVTWLITSKRERGRTIFDNIRHKYALEKYEKVLGIKILNGSDGSTLVGHRAFIEIKHAFYGSGVTSCIKKIFAERRKQAL